MKPLRSVVIAIAFLWGASSVARAQDPDFTLTDPDAELGYQFGSSVAIDYPYIIVGEWQAGDPSEIGAALIFKWIATPGTWNHKTIVPDTENMLGANFGRSVAIDGASVVVGAYNEDDCSFRDGVAYKFVRTSNNWDQIQRIVPDDCDDISGDRFGTSVDIDGDYVIVGAYLANEGNCGINPCDAAGAAYIFDEPDWENPTKLSLTSAIPYLTFGRSVSISGGFAVVGAPYGDEVGPIDVGSAYVYELTGSGWGLVATLTDESLSAGANFGTSVSIDGDRMIIGAKDAGNNGAAYVYERDIDNWNQMGDNPIMPISFSSGDNFGAAVAIQNVDEDDCYVIIGAQKASSTDIGAAYVYSWDSEGESWVEIGSFDGDNNYDEFGHSVSLEWPYAVVGAPKADGVEEDEGKAYVYDLSEPPPRQGLTIDEPITFRLDQNYPNPFNPTTKIAFELPTDAWVTLTVYDMLGREVSVLVDAFQESGPKSFQWDGTNTSGNQVSSGIYTYRLKAGDIIASRRMSLVR